MRSLIVSSVILLAAACSEPQPEPPQTTGDSLPIVADTLAMSTGPKACDVVSAEELERIVGFELKPGRTTNDYAGTSQCQWDRESGTEGGVSITVRERGDMAIYRAVPGSTPVSGIGDEAVWADTLNQLAFREGARLMSVSLLYKPARRDLAEQIARVAASKLED